LPCTDSACIFAVERAVHGQDPAATCHTRPYRPLWAARFCQSPRSLNPHTRQAASYSRLVAGALARAIDDRRRRRIVPTRWLSRPAATLRRTGNLSSGMLHACRTCCCARVPAVGGHPPADPGRCIGRSSASRRCTARRSLPGAPCRPSYNSAWSRHDVPFPSFRRFF